MLDLDLIRIDGGTQSRAQLNDEKVAEYAEHYRNEVDMPPVIVFFDGKDWWLADGFHRYWGAKAAGRKTILEKITPGTRRDAKAYSLGANHDHGIPRTNADKRNAVTEALKDEEWGGWTDVAIAKLCRVSANFVGDMRRIINPIDDGPVKRTVERGGKTYTMSTGNIGGKVVGQQSAAQTGPADVQPTPTPGPAAPPAAPTVPAVPAADPKTARIAELEDQVATLTAELIAAREEARHLEEILGGDDKMAAALSEAKKSRDLARGYKARIDSMTTQIAELKRSAASWKSRAEKAEKAEKAEAAA